MSPIIVIITYMDCKNYSYFSYFIKVIGFQYDKVSKDVTTILSIDKRLSIQTIPIAA